MPPFSENDDIQAFASSTAKSLQLLMEARLYNQALIVMYCAMDALAWCSKPHGRSSRRDFFEWCNKYIKSEKLGFTCFDLYAARCALLHSNTVEYETDADIPWIKLEYVVGVSEYHRKKILEQAPEEIIVVEVSELIELFFQGVDAFIDDIAHSFTPRRICESRMQQWMRFAPISEDLEREFSGPVF